jgi:hypothetical protein
MRPALVPGLLGGMLAILMGAWVVLISFASTSEHSIMGLGGVLSPMAGGLLLILLGLMALVGAILESGGDRSAKALLAFTVLIYLPVIPLSPGYFLWSFSYGIFEEWIPLLAAVILLAAMAVAVFFKRPRAGSALLLLAGLMGFIISQDSLVFYFGGWKYWIVPGILLILGGVLFLVPSQKMAGLPLLSSPSKAMRWSGYLLYSLVILGLMLILAGALYLLPDKETSTRSNLMEAEMAMTMGLPDKALEAYDRVLALDPANRLAQKGRQEALLRMAAQNLSSQSLAGCETAMDINQSPSGSILKAGRDLSSLQESGEPRH